MSIDPNKKQLILLDMHAILHRGYHALPDFTTMSGQSTGALYGLALMLLSIIKELSPDYIVGCYDLPDPTHRHKAFEDYKAHRPETDEELVSQIIASRDLLDAFSIEWYEKAGFEADDLLGTISKLCLDDDNGGKDLQIIIASGDLDTLQLVDGERVQVYTLKGGIKDTVLYDEEQVNERFGFGPELLPDYKGLRGDVSDNIPGISGVGEKTASNLLKTYGSLEDIYNAFEADGVEAVAKKAGVGKSYVQKVADGKDEAQFSKMLATIRLDVPIDFSLPNKIWSETVDPEKILHIFDKYEFRTIKNRVKALFKTEDTSDSKSENEEEEPNEPKLSDSEIKELEIALWLLDSTITRPDEEKILEYAETKNLSEARGKIMLEIEQKNLTRVLKEIEIPLIPIVEQMEETGIKIDHDYFSALEDEYQDEIDKIEAQIFEYAGEEFNPNSPQQLQEVLFETLGIATSGIKKTSTGNFSTAESELHKIEDKHPIVPLIFEHRKLAKLLGTYIKPILELSDENDRLHASFVQTGTTTGRMASENPNLQNIPIKTEEGRRIRNGFVAEEGFVLCSCDYSQIELRIAAVLSEDDELLKVFREKRDIHSRVASAVFDKDPEEISKAERAKAKTINFGILYGMGVNALRKNLGDDTSRSEAQSYLDEYFNEFSGLSEWIEETKQEVKEQGYTTTYFGRRRQFPGIYSSAQYVRAQAERMAVNAPIQGTQADIIKLAMIKINSWLEEESLSEDARLLLQVHDELVYEIKEDKKEEIVPEIKELMEEVVDPEETSGITFTADARTGKNWGELEPYST